MTCDRLHLVGNVAVVVTILLCSTALAQTADPHKLLAEADRLAWLKAWTRAEPIYAEAEQLFTGAGDRRNGLYARINRLRGELPRLPVPEVSYRLAEYLEDPLVQADDALRLRTLIIKGETDTDLDPVLAERSWREAMAIAERLGEAGWANRARGELGLLAFLQGNVNAAVIQLGQALKVAETNGDTPSVVRWLTLFGHGYVELGRPAEALDMYDRALKIAASIPELQFPAMTYVGKGDALQKLGRLDEAERLLNDALRVAAGQGALGYQADLLIKIAEIALRRKDLDRAAQLLGDATDLGHRAGGGRLVARASLERARVLRLQNRITESERVLDAGTSAARAMQERLLLPRLLTELADVRASQRQHTEAAALLDEASDLLEGFLTNASSPWVQSRIINGARDLFLARIRLEGARGPDAARLFAIVEQARGRALLELLLAKPLADLKQPGELRTQERRIAALQVQLFRVKTRAERQRLLDEIFVAEEQLAPLTTAAFDRARGTSPRKFLTLPAFQRILGRNEVVLQFALAEPRSYVLVITSNTARVQSLPGRSALQRLTQTLLEKIRAGDLGEAEADALGSALLGPLREVARASRIIVSPDGELHQVPFELLPTASGRRLLETHVVSYVQSGSVLSVLRARDGDGVPTRTALAVSASSDQVLPTNMAGITRSVYDFDGKQLRPLPSANDEARSVAAILGGDTTTLVADAATERAVKQQPLHEYRVLHFAAHGIPSTRYPARAALLLRDGDGEDGLLQAREILTMRLRAEVVTLSACDTGGGSLHEQEGVTSLIRPFLAVGARSVVANLWAADDQFSLALMREFYRHIAAGVDVADALRRAKLRLLEQFGPEAVPRLWSGVLAYGDGAATGVQRLRSVSGAQP